MVPRHAPGPALPDSDSDSASLRGESQTGERANAMKSKPNPPPSTEKSQIDKFRDAARELECDDDEEAFAERVRRMATAPRPAQKEKG